ncbi:transcriptional regulator [Streptomyces sp. CS149]|uniref:ArsR/SmtB family transcription factor n=1 Tax=Streptomyces sp. CS149 TaxID=2109332 RepID=UPI000D19FDF8|nr:winged helix-turn-helix domain-containing protein [Streptomyces sp. CS149]PSK71035.1 transcriptional regulator [Streptomyces sp. CS149]
MALRIHFTADDLTRITVAPRPDPMWELVNSLHILQRRPTVSAYAPWLRHVRQRLASSDLRSPIRLLTTLVPPRGDFPDFLTPPHKGGLEAARDLVLATPTARLRTELSGCYGQRRPSTWLRRLAEGERGARQELDGAFLTYFRELLAPQLHLIDDVVHADRAHHSRDVLAGGAERLLNALSPSIRWEPPTLVADYPRDGDLHLGGRGISLVPSFFCTERPVTLIDPELPPVLVYPVSRRPASAGPLDGLPELLGRTRAMALCALSSPCSTGELARRIGVSIGTASKHASVLRTTKLVTSTRRGGEVVHALTPLGRELAQGRRGGSWCCGPDPA